MSPNRPERVEHPIEMISAYMDGRLEAVDRARVHDHLVECSACQRILADFRALAVAARREAPPPVPAHLLEKIGRRLDADSAARPIPGRPLSARSRFRPRARLPLATAAAVLVMATFWVVWRGRIPGDRLAESQSNAAPPATAPVTEQVRPPQPETAAPPQPETAAPLPAKPEARPLAKQTAPPADDMGKRERLDAFAPSPPAAPPKTKEASPTKKDGAAQAGALADRVEAQVKPRDMMAARSQAPVPAPAEKLDQAEADEEGIPAGAVVGAAAAEGAAGGPPQAGEAKPPATSRMTLVLVLEEARVSILPSLGVVLIAGDYACALPAGGQEEARGLAELRAYATSQKRAARAAAAEAPPAGYDSSEAGEPTDLVVPAPPASGPLADEAAAEAHRRMWILLRESLLARAEAKCGPAPQALHPER